MRVLSRVPILPRPVDSARASETDQGPRQSRARQEADLVCMAFPRRIRSLTVAALHGCGVKMPNRGVTPVRQAEG